LTKDRLCACPLSPVNNGSPTLPPCHCEPLCLPVIARSPLALLSLRGAPTCRGDVAISPSSLRATCPPHSYGSPAEVLRRAARRERGNLPIVIASEARQSLRLLRLTELSLAKTEKGCHCEPPLRLSLRAKRGNLHLETPLPSPPYPLSLRGAPSGRRGNL